MGFPLITFHVSRQSLPAWWKPLSDAGFIVTFQRRGAQQFTEAPPPLSSEPIDFDARVLGFDGDQLVNITMAQDDDVAAVVLVGSSRAAHRLCAVLIASGMRLAPAEDQKQLGFDAIWIFPKGTNADAAWVMSFGAMVRFAIQQLRAGKAESRADKYSADVDYPSGVIRRGLSAVEWWTGPAGPGRTFLALRRRGIGRELLSDVIECLDRWACEQEGTRIMNVYAH